LSGLLHHGAKDDNGDTRTTAARTSDGGKKW